MHNEELYQKYPTLFRQTKLGRHESCMYYGIECGKGWLPLIGEMSDELSKFDGIEYARIKEKFACLRVYIDYAESVSNDVKIQCRDIVSKYTALSSSTCEICGTPAKLCRSDFGWLSTLCDEHRQEKAMEYVTK